MTTCKKLQLFENHHGLSLEWQQVQVHWHWMDSVPVPVAKGNFYAGQQPFQRMTTIPSRLQFLPWWIATHPMACVQSVPTAKFSSKNSCHRWIKLSSLLPKAWQKEDTFSWDENQQKCVTFARPPRRPFAWWSYQTDFRLVWWCYTISLSSMWKPLRLNLKIVRNTHSNWS